MSDIPHRMRNSPKAMSLFGIAFIVGRNDQHAAVKCEQLFKLPTGFETRSPGAYSSMRIATDTGERFHLLSAGGQASA